MWRYYVRFCVASLAGALLAFGEVGVSGILIILVSLAYLAKFYRLLESMDAPRTKPRAKSPRRKPSQKGGPP